METLLQTQMFPSLAARETHVAETNFASWKQGNVSELSQEHILVYCSENWARDACSWPSSADQEPVVLKRR